MWNPGQILVITDSYFKICGLIVVFASVKKKKKYKESTKDMRILIRSQDVKIYCSLSAFNAPLCPLTDSEPTHCLWALLEGLAAGTTPLSVSRSETFQKPLLLVLAPWGAQKVPGAALCYYCWAPGHRWSADVFLWDKRVKISGSEAAVQCVCVASGQNVVRSSRTITGRLLAVPQATAPLSVIFHFHALWKYQNIEINNAEMTDSSH